MHIYLWVKHIFFNVHIRLILGIIYFGLFIVNNLFIEKLNNLLSRVSLIDILGDRYKIVPRGGNKYTVQCPFHKDGQETNPSMSVDNDKGVYKCFTCGAKGNVITYLKEKENKTFKEAIQYLGNRFSIDVSDFFSAKTSQKDKIYLESRRINRIACNFFGKTLFLKDKDGTYFYKEAEKYLKNRKIPFSIIKEFKIGYAPPSWNALINALTENKVSINNMNILGLASVSKNNPNHYYDTFVNRIMFPIINEREEVIGFGGRSIDGKEPKYLNSKESLIFKKKSCLYGINIAKTHIMKQDEVILVEGYMDTIACHKMGIKNVVGTLGTAITEEHAIEIKKYTKNVILALDGDEAGIKATKMAILTLLKFDLKLTILSIKETKDLDEFFTVYAKERFDILYNNRLNWYDFIIEMDLKKDISSASIEEKLSIINSFYKYLDVVNSETEKQMIISYMASKLLVDREAFNKDYLRNHKSNQHISNNKSIKKADNNNKFYYENSLIYLLALNPSLIKEAEREISVDLIKKDITREFYIRLLTLNKEASVQDALDILGNEHVANQILSKQKLYTENIYEKLEELIIKIKSGDIDSKRQEVLHSNTFNNTLESNDGFEAICAKAREIHLLNKQKEKLHQGSDL